MLKHNNFKLNFESLVLAILVISFISLFTSTAAFAENTQTAPKRLALLPPVLQNSDVDSYIVDNTQEQLEQALHVPLNDVLKRIDYLSEEDSTAAFKDAFNTEQAKAKKVKIINLLKPIADDLNADIVIIPVIRNSYQNVVWGGMWDDGDYRYISWAHIELYIYTGTDGQSVVYKANDSYSGSYNRYCQLDSLIKNCTASVIQQSKLYTLVQSKQTTKPEV